MSRAAKTTMMLMIVTVFSKVIGLFRESIMAANYGTGMYKAIYDTANSIPVVIFAIVATALATSFIPVFNRLQTEEGTERTLRFTNSVINIVVIISLIISVVGIIFARPIVKIFAIGYEGKVLDMAVTFTRILLPSIIMVGVANILTSFLQVKNKFIIPGLIGLPYNIIVIASIILSKHTNVFVLVVGTLLAITSKTLFMVPEARRQGLRYSFSFDRNDPALKEMVVLIMPVLIGVSVGQINSLVDKSLATTLGLNVVSSFGYAMKLYEFVQALFITSILSVVYPKLASFTANKQMDRFNDGLRKTLSVLIVALVPIIVGAATLAVPIVRILFQRNNFTASDTIITANILMIYTTGLLAFALRDVMSRGFYSLHDSKTPMYNSIIAIIFNIVLNLLFVKPLGYRGLAIATAISSYIGLALFHRGLKKKVGNFGQRKVFIVALKAFASAAVMGVVAYFVHTAMESFMGTTTMDTLISLMVAVVSGTIVYVIGIHVLKVEEYYEIKDMILGMFKRKLKRFSRNK